MSPSRLLKRGNRLNIRLLAHTTLELLLCLRAKELFLESVALSLHHFLLCLQFENPCSVAHCRCRALENLFVARGDSRVNLATTWPSRPRLLHLTRMLFLGRVKQTATSNMGVCSARVLDSETRVTRSRLMRSDHSRGGLLRVRAQRADHVSSEAFEACTREPFFCCCLLSSVSRVNATCSCHVTSFTRFTVQYI